MPTRVQATTPTHLFTETISIQRPSYSTGTAGGKAHSYSAHLTNIAAAFQPQEGSEFDEYGREHTQPRGAFYTAGGQDIQTKDRVVYGTRRFDIKSVKDIQIAAIILKLDVEELIP